MEQRKVKEMIEHLTAWGKANPVKFLGLYVEYLHSLSCHCKEYKIFTSYKEAEEFVGEENILKVIKNANAITPHYNFSFKRKYYLLGLEYFDGRPHYDVCELYGINKPTNSIYTVGKAGEDMEELARFVIDEGIKLA